MFPKHLCALTLLSLTACGILSGKDDDGDGDGIDLDLGGNGVDDDTGVTFTYAGYAVESYFPLDGQRSWEYAAEDLDWHLSVDLVDRAKSDDIEVVTLEYSEKDTKNEALLYTIDWSSDSENGVLIHRFEVEGGDSVEFDTPVVFGSARMTPEDTEETDTNGYSFTSTFQGIEDCPNYWVADDWECLYFTFDDDGAGVPFAGHWWLAAVWGPSRFIPTGHDDPWVLVEPSWAPE